MKISEKLNRVFTIELTADKTRTLFTEACDYYFSATLTKKEMLDLIDGLKLIADQMKEDK